MGTAAHQGYAEVSSMKEHRESGQTGRRKARRELCHRHSGRAKAPVLRGKAFALKLEEVSLRR